MTTPSIFADTAGQAKVDRSGAVRSVKAVATIPAATAANTIVGLVRFQKGFSLQHLAAVATSMDAGTDLLLDFGYVYDDNVTYTDDPNAFVDGSTIAQAGGSVVWPVAAGLSVGSGFVAEADGYITVQLTDNTAETGGTVTVNALFSYDK